MQRYKESTFNKKDTFESEIDEYDELMYDKMFDRIDADDDEKFQINLKIKSKSKKNNSNNDQSKENSFNSLNDDRNLYELSN